MGRHTRTVALRAALALGCVVVESPVLAQEPEPVSVLYDAPASECPDGSAFFHEITARTTRARAALTGEKARVIHVAIVKSATGRAVDARFTGRLLIEETTSWSSAREVQSATCAEVVEALGLIAALAVDPKASMAPRAALVSSPAAATVAPAASAPGPQPTASPTVEAQPSPSSAVEPRPALTPRSSRRRFAVGAQVEGSAVAELVVAGRLFGDLELGDRARVLSPAFRIALSRSLDVDRRPAIGAATLRWTQASLEGCPLRFAFTRSLSTRPCAAFAGGILEAESTGLTGGGRSRTRPWASLAAQGRLVWEPTPWLGIEVEAGLVMPLYRETFFFEPRVPVYEAPAIAFLSRAGAAVRFP